MRWERVASIALLLVLYGIIMEFAGHGGGPLALLLVFGWPQVWGSAQLPGWIGIGVLIRSLFISGQSFLSYRGWGATLLGCSLWLFASSSEAVLFTVMTAIPFHIAWGYTIWQGYRGQPAFSKPALDRRPTTVLYAVLFFGFTLLLRLPYLVGGLWHGPQEGQPWLSHLLPLLLFAGDLVLIYAIWIGKNWARWAFLALALWGWGQFMWYAGATLTTLSPQTLVVATHIVATTVAFVMVFTPPGSRWFQTIGHSDQRRDPQPAAL